MKTKYTAEDLDTTIRTLLEMCEEWDDSGMQEEKETALKAALLLRRVRQEQEEADE